MNASSSGVSRQLSGTHTAPILAIAKKLSMYSTLFIIRRATRVALLDASRSQEVRRAIRALVPLGKGEAPGGVAVDEPLHARRQERPLGEKEAYIVLHAAYLSSRRRCFGERVCECATRPRYGRALLDRDVPRQNVSGLEPVAKSPAPATVKPVE